MLRILAFTAVAWLAPLPAVAADAASGHDLIIVTSTGDHAFSTEVMRSRAELEKGLMFRRQMPADHGMLFDFGSPQPVAMWMKNTYLPLDMLFIGQDGRIVSIKENAAPMSENIISSGGPVTGVLELKAGVGKAIGVQPGDRVRHPMFGP